MTFVGTVNCPKSLNCTLWVAVEVFIQFSLWSGNRSANWIRNKEDYVKLTHHTFRLLTGWKNIVLQQILYERDVGFLLSLVLGAETFYMGLYRESVFNKCSQHYFLHPVWLHFSPEGNQNNICHLAWFIE